jgi:hypothetical protein
LYFIEPINPSSFVGHIFILTATNYFTKWTEAVPFKHAQDEQIISFLESNIFSHFGLPIKIIYNNGPTFTFGKLTQFLNKFGVKHFIYIILERNNILLKKYFDKRDKSTTFAADKKGFIMGFFS